MKRRKKLLKNIKNRRSGELPVEKEQKEIDNLDQKLSGINHDIVFSERLDRNITMWKNFEQKQLFYYSHELDFRMRIYPHSPQTHPMGNMLSRAVVQFTEKYQMDIEAFKITATKKFLKCIGLNIAEILAIYNASIISYLQSFRKKEVLYMKKQKILLDFYLNILYTKSGVKMNLPQHLKYPIYLSYFVFKNFFSLVILYFLNDFLFNIILLKIRFNFKRINWGLFFKG